MGTFQYKGGLKIRTDGRNIVFNEIYHERG